MSTREESPENDVYVLENDQIQNEEVSPSQALLGFVATPVLQDTLAHMLNILEGMTQAGILPNISDGSQDKVGGQTLDQQATTCLQIPLSQSVAAVAPRLKGMPFLVLLCPQLLVLSRYLRSKICLRGSGRWILHNLRVDRERTLMCL